MNGQVICTVPCKPVHDEIGKIETKLDNVRGDIIGRPTFWKVISGMVLFFSLVAGILIYNQRETAGKVDVVKEIVIKNSIRLDNVLNGQSYRK